MADLPLPNLDEIPDLPSPIAGKQTAKPSPQQQPAVASPTKLPGFKLPSIKTAKLPTIQRPIIKLASVPWRIIFTILGVIIVVGVAAFFLFFWKATVTITSTPIDALIQIADQSATGLMKAVLQPKTYHLSVKRQDFIPYEIDLKLNVHEKRNLEITLRDIPTPMQLSDKLVQFMTLDPDRTSLLFLAPNQKIVYRLILKDLVHPTLDNITPDPGSIEGITDFIWSPNRQLAFIKLHDITKQYDFKRYDLVNQETHDWPAGVGSIDWKPDGEKVAYDYEPVDGERTIIRATKDNSEQERIFNLLGTTITHPKLKWSPDSKQLSFVTTELHTLDTFSKELKTFDKLGPIKDALWLPTSTGLIVQGQDDQLSLVTLTGEVTKLGVTGNIDQVVSFSDGKAVVFTRERNSKTEFYRIQLDTQAQSPYIFRSQAPLAPTNLILSKDEKTLFFVSAGHPTALTLDTGQY
jgi:hypothetical protein